MPPYDNAYSGFSTNDIAAARGFYAETLGLEVSEENGMLTLNLPGGARVLVYPKESHQPATYTCLNFEVPDIEAAVDALVEGGVTFERYEGMPHDERGVVREWGPPIAWFTDPAGNILAVIESAG
jgi:catechol 2,3-dioxygenase-like lactoylglutathione lyase family enzyme